MSLEMKASLLIVCLFQVSLAACPAGEKLDDGGQCTKTCPEGTYVNSTNGCSECPKGYYMNETEHTRTKCNKCRWIRQYHEADSIVQQNCTARSDLIIRCRGNYYIQIVHPDDDVREVTCFECRVCSNGERHEIRPCNGIDDTLCCESEDMVAHTDAQGRITCGQGTTTAGTPSTISAEVIVTQKSELKITPNGPELIVKANARQELVCNIRTSETSTKVKWFPENVSKTTRLDKTEVDGSNVYLFQSTLIFTNFEAQHKGNYTCQATGENGKSATIFLDYITETKSDALFGYGNKTAELSCAIDHKYSSVVWLQNTTLISELKDNARFVAQNTTLIINNPERTDGNKYIARFTLDIAPQNKSETYDCEVEFFANPFVKDFEKSKNLIQEDNLELQCQVLGYPPAVVTWYKDNEPLNATVGDRVLLFPLKGYKNAILKIKNVDFNDAGDYKCEAFSDHFNDSSAKVVTVRVKDKLAALWPFLGIVGEVLVLCTIIFIYEKRRNKQAEQEENNAQEAKSAELKAGVRHRGQKK